MRKLGLVVVVGFALAVTPAGAEYLGAAATSLSGTAQPGPGTSVTLQLTSGADSILFLRVQAPAGKAIDSASAQGVSCQAVGGQARCGPFNPTLAKDKTLALVVHSAQGLSPADGPFNAFATSNGERDDGPFMINWLQPCECDDLTITMKAKDAYSAAGELVPTGDRLARFGGLMTWTIDCTEGLGGCSGDFTVVPPKKSDITVKTYAAVPFVPKAGPFKGKTLYKPGKPEKLTFHCAAACAASTSGQFYLKADSKKDLLPASRAGKTITFTFDVDCNGPVVEKLKLVFKANGDLDRKKSSFTK